MSIKSTRLKAINFTKPILRKGLKKQAFILLMNALPDDALIVGFNDDYIRNVTVMCVYSETYKEAPENQILPELNALFTENENGVITSCEITEH